MIIYMPLPHYDGDIKRDEAGKLFIMPPPRPRMMLVDIPVNDNSVAALVEKVLAQHYRLDNGA